jgi:hypothetical protein
MIYGRTSNNKEGSKRERNNQGGSATIERSVIKQNGD